MSGTGKGGTAGRRTKETRPHPAVTFVEQLSRVVNEHLPSMWKLGVASLQRMAGRTDDEAQPSLDDIAAYASTFFWHAHLCLSSFI